MPVQLPEPSVVGASSGDLPPRRQQLEDPPDALNGEEVGGQPSVFQYLGTQGHRGGGTPHGCSPSPS